MADAGMVSDNETTRREVAARMAEAASAWLETLDAEQRAIGQGAVPADDPSDNERRRWFYTPTDHGGLTIHQQRPAQQRAAMRLVSTGLSPAAYVSVATMMGLENVLDYIEGFVVAVRPGAWSRPWAVLPAGVRRAGQRTSVGLAVRRPPRVVEQPRGGRHARRDDAVLPGCGSRYVAAARRSCQSATWHGWRTWAAI